MINKKAWKYYFGFYRGKYRSIWGTFLLSVIQSVLVLPVVFFTKNLIDEVIPSSNTESLILIGCILIVLIVLSGALSFLTRRIALLLNTTVIKELREDLIQRHYSLPTSYMTKADRGKLHSIFMQDIGRVEGMGETLVSNFLRSLFMTVVLAVILFHLNWTLFMVLVLLFPLLVFVTQKMGMKIRLKVDAFRKSVQDLSKRMFFVLWMGELTRLQTAEQTEMLRQKQGLEDYRQRNVSMSLMQSIYGVIQKSLTGFFGVLVLVIGGFAIASGSMTLGSLISFYLAARLLQGYASPLLSAIPTVIAGNESLVEIHRYVSSEERAPYSGSNKIEFQGNVSMRNVSFGYGDETVLKDASMEIEAGSTVVVLGPNGAGKSTISNLILGLYRPEIGSLKVEGCSYDEISVQDLRRQIGVVPQIPIFFKGSIYDNIVYGSSDVDYDRVVEASRRAGSHDFISKLKDGYDTQLGDGGSLVSGGEKQLIAICRALLRSPKLLILDEPTNHLGKDAVRALMRNLAEESGSRTTLVISHHWEVAREASRIYYLDKAHLREIEEADLAALSDQLSEDSE